MTASSRGSSSDAPSPSAASTRYWRVLVCGRRPPAAMRDRDQRAQRHVRIAGIAHLPAIVTNVFVAPVSNHTSPLIICCSQASRAASSAPRSSGSACWSRRPDDVDEPELVGKLRRPHQPLALLPGIGGERGGALERRRRDRDRAAAPRRHRVVFERGGDLLVGAHGRHRPMPEPALRVRPRSSASARVHLEYLAGEGRLPHRRADQRVTKPQLRPDDLDQPRRDRGSQGGDSDRACANQQPHTGRSRPGTHGCRAPRPAD